MGFRILDANGKAIELKTLNEDVAEFWEQDLQQEYVKPKEFSVGNWFDVIGWRIDNPINEYAKSWDNVKNGLFVAMCAGMYKQTFDELTDNVVAIKLIMESYFALIDHWEEKGYTPYKTEE